MLYNMQKHFPPVILLNTYDSLARQQDNRHNYLNPVDEETALGSTQSKVSVNKWQSSKWHGSKATCFTLSVI